MVQVQQSYQTNEVGVLYIVPTPIGNLQDMTYRAVDTLQQVDTILAEDTRHTQKLLRHFAIDNPLLSFHEHNTESRLPQIIERLKLKEQFALVSDAGMPAISDPGFELVQAAIQEEIPVIVLPGAAALVNAVVASGLPTDEFVFHGFLPKKQTSKQAELERLSEYKGTIVLYESPYRVKETVQSIVKYIGNRKLVIAREITKMYEQFIRGTGDEVLTYLQANQIKGECCIVIEGNTSDADPTLEQWWEAYTIPEHVAYYETEKGMSNKLAMKQAAKDRGISKREIYQEIHVK